MGAAPIRESRTAQRATADISRWGGEQARRVNRCTALTKVPALLQPAKCPATGDWGNTAVRGHSEVPQCLVSPVVLLPNEGSV